MFRNNIEILGRKNICFIPSPIDPLKKTQKNTSASIYGCIAKKLNTFLGNIFLF